MGFFIWINPIQDPRQNSEIGLGLWDLRGRRGHEQQAMVGLLEGFGDETGDLPRRFAGGGPAICVW
jgi:hypothetical protein